MAKKKLPQFRVKLDQDSIAEALGEILLVYSKNVTEEVIKAIDEVTETTLENVRRDSPSRTGEYSEGWQSKTMFESELDKRNMIYNTTKPSLTHLLEWGHIVKNSPEGRTAEKKPHVMPNYEKAVKELTQKVIEAIKHAD